MDGELDRRACAPGVEGAPVVEVGAARVHVTPGFNVALLGQVVRVCSRSVDDPLGAQVFVAVEPVDGRYGFERLAGMVRERMGFEPRSGSLFVFVGPSG